MLSAAASENSSPASDAAPDIASAAPENASSTPDSDSAVAESTSPEPSPATSEIVSRSEVATPQVNNAPESVGTIVLEIIDERTAKPIKGAVFHPAKKSVVNGATVLEKAADSVATDETGCIKWGNLPLGTYALVSESLPTGYTEFSYEPWNPAEVKIQLVERDVKKTLHVIPDAGGPYTRYFEVFKLDGDNNNAPIEGATYKLELNPFSGPVYFGTATTDKNGRAVFENIEISEGGVVPIILTDITPFGGPYTTGCALKDSVACDGYMSPACSDTIIDIAHKAVYPTGVTLSETVQDMHIRGHIKLSATVAPSNTSDKSIQWSSSNPLVAEIRERPAFAGSVYVDAVGEGTAIITATARNGKSASCTVNVTEEPPNPDYQSSLKLKVVNEKTGEPVQGVVFQPRKFIVYGNTSKVIDIAEPATTDKNGYAIWEKTFSIDDYGLVATSLPAGYTEIARSNGAMEYESTGFSITENPSVVEKTLMVFPEGDVPYTRDIVGYKLDGDNNNAPIAGATYKLIRYESGDISTVVGTATTDKNGKVVFDDVEISQRIATTVQIVDVTANSLYTTDFDTGTIAVASGGYKSPPCAYSFKDVAHKTVFPTSIKLDATKSMIVETSADLTATVAPANATYKAATWSSSNTAVAKVSARGRVTAVKVGTANITATASNGLTATCTVTVTLPPVKVTDVKMDKTLIELVSGNSTTLVATIIPANATNKTIQWTSGDNSIATVVNGKVTGVKAGWVVLRATAANGEYAECSVMVTAAPVNATGVSLNKKSFALVVGGSERLTATVAPSNTTNRNIMWSSSNTAVATVSDGKITARKAGTATITAKTSNGKTATCTVTVTAIMPTKVTLDKTAITLVVKSSEAIRAIISPANATNQSIAWSTSNSAVATVSGGNVTAIKPGTATITAKSSNGKTASCSVRVVTAIVFPERIEWIFDTTMTVGGSQQTHVTVLPADTTDKSLKWKSSNPAVATVDGKGFIKAIKEGETIITVTTSDGNGYTSVFTVTKGSTPPVVTEPPIATDAGIDGFVERLYSVACNRKSDAKGKANWIAQLKSGKENGAAVARGFILSDEFTKRKLSNDAFIKTMYKTFFDRDADKAGYKTWMEALSNGMSREFALQGFSNSDEFLELCEKFGVTRGSLTCTQSRDQNQKLTAFVYRLYAKLLERDGEEKGLNNWSASILNKTQTPKGVAYGFVFGKEFTEKNYSNADFIEHMYTTFLGRPSEAEGKEMWVQQMVNGKTRQQIFDGFADGDEFAGIVKEFGL